jgi:hypothetical protein
MAAQYEVLQMDMKTGNVVTALHLTGLSFTETLNAPGTADIGIPLNAAEADPAKLTPGGTGLVVMRDGMPTWGGIFWAAQADLAANTLTLSASGYHSHYQHRVFASSVEWQSVEQATLLSTWFSLVNSANGINTDATGLAPTGHVRSRAWSRYELKHIGEAIEELADDIGGFNFRYVPYWIDQGKRFGNRFLISERSGVQTSHVLTHGRNCNVTQVTYDSTALCTIAFSLGADIGNGEKLVGIMQNTELASRIPSRAMVATYQDVKETQTLISKSAATLNAGLAPVAIPTLTLYPDMFSPLDFIPGDACSVEVDYGYVALLDDFVVTDRRTEVDANGQESISLALANKELFTNANPS